MGGIHPYLLWKISKTPNIDKTEVMKNLRISSKMVICIDIQFLYNIRIMVKKWLKKGGVSAANPTDLGEHVLLEGLHLNHGKRRIDEIHGSICKR